MSPVLNFTEMRPVGAAPIRAGRKTDMTKLIGSFPDYANTSKSCRIQQYKHLVQLKFRHDLTCVLVVFK